MEVFASMLRGMGSAIAPTLITVVGICGVRIFWIYTIFAVDHRLDILYLSYPVSWFLTAGTLFFCYIHVHKKLMRAVCAAPAPASEPHIEGSPSRVNVKAILVCRPSRFCYAFAVDLAIFTTLCFCRVFFLTSLAIMVNFAYNVSVYSCVKVEVEYVGA